MNADDWLKKLESADIDSNTTEVDGRQVSVWQDDSIHSTSVSQTLYVTGTELSFSRSGVKVVSYDRWTDTDWFDWEVAQ